MISMAASEGRPGSNAGEAIGELDKELQSALGRSVGSGSMSSAVATHRTLVSPSLTCTLPGSAPNATASSRGSSAPPVMAQAAALEGMHNEATSDAEMAGGLCCMRPRGQMDDYR